MGVGPMVLVLFIGKTPMLRESAPKAQWVRAPGLHPGGWWFKSISAHNE